MKHVLVVVAALVLASLAAIAISGRAEFMAGGALVNLGFRLQDHLEPYDPDGEPELTPEQIFPELRARYPYLAQAIDERAQRNAELLKRPALAARIAKSELVVKHVHVDTSTAQITVE